MVVIILVVIMFGCGFCGVATYGELLESVNSNVPRTFLLNIMLASVLITVATLYCLCDIKNNHYYNDSYITIPKDKE